MEYVNSNTMKNGIRVSNGFEVLINHAVWMIYVSCMLIPKYMLGLGHPGFLAGSLGWATALFNSTEIWGWAEQTSQL